MRILIMLFLAVCCSYGSYSQVLTVYDNLLGQPLELATISSESPRVFAVTNVRGQVNISDFKGSEKIEIRLIGFKTLQQSYVDIENTQFIIRMDKAEFSLDDVVISATKWNQSKKDIPSKITSITPKSVELQNPQTAADLLGTSGEVYIQKSQQGGGSPMIRGFATNRLLITIDGIRMNTAIFRSGNVQNVISLDPYATENTEIFFGPGSIIYGSDAIGGVMSFQTLTPQLSATDTILVTGKAATRLSSANSENTFHFDIGVGGKKWASVSSFTFSDYDDLKMGSHGPEEYLRPIYSQRQDSIDVAITNDDRQVQVPTAYSQTNFMQKFRFKPNNKWDFQYGFHYSTTGDYDRYDRLIRYRNGLPRSAEWYYGPQVWMMNNLLLSHTGNYLLFDDMNIRVAQQLFKESRHDRGFNDDILYNREEKVDALSLNLDFVKRVGSNTKMFYGAEIVNNDVESTGTDEYITSGESETGPSRYPQSTWSSYAAYLSLEHHFTQKIMISGGVRYNQYLIDADFSNNLPFYPLPVSTVKINDGAFTGSLGLVFNPTEKWSINVNASTGFRAPNVDDLGKIFDSEAGSAVVPNPDLEAEYAYNAEVGLSKIFGDFVKFELAGYYTLLENAMVRRDYTLNGEDSIIYDGELSQVQAIQNAATATVYGVEAGVEIKLPAGFSFGSQFNYQIGEEELDDGTTSPSRHAAPWFGISRFTYTQNKLTLELNTFYSGEKSYDDLAEEEKGKPEIYAIDNNGDPYSPAWYTLNFKVMYKFSEWVSMSGGIENITDQRYRPYSSGLAGAGRNLVFAVKANF